MEKTAAKTTSVEWEPQLPTKKPKREEPQHQHNGESKSAGAEVSVVDVDPEALSCRGCLHHLVPPVLQCAAGHLICSSCHDSLPDKNKCASCFTLIKSFTPTSYSRCHAVEGILRSVRFAFPDTIAGYGGLPKGVVKMGPCGGVDADATDMDLGVVDRIIKVVVWHRDAVDAMSVLYEQDGREKETDPVWGESVGERSEICLASDEYLTSVKGHIGQYQGHGNDDYGEDIDILIVRSLTFVTNRHFFGPYGNEEGDPFELPAAGGRIVGFHGRSRHFITALGTYVKVVV